MLGASARYSCLHTPVETVTPPRRQRKLAPFRFPGLRKGRDPFAPQGQLSAARIRPFSCRATARVAPTRRSDLLRLWIVHAEGLRGDEADIFRQNRRIELHLRRAGIGHGISLHSLQPPQPYYLVLAHNPSRMLSAQEKELSAMIRETFDNFFMQ